MRQPIVFFLSENAGRGPTWFSGLAEPAAGKGTDTLNANSDNGPNDFDRTSPYHPSRRAAGIAANFELLKQARRG
jgi:hypothetical protein